MSVVINKEKMKKEIESKISAIIESNPNYKEREDQQVIYKAIYFAGVESVKQKIQKRVKDLSKSKDSAYKNIVTDELRLILNSIN